MSVNCREKRNDGFGARARGFLDFVGLSLCERNMIGHAGLSDWFTEVFNRSTSLHQRGSQRRLQAGQRGLTFRPANGEGATLAICDVLILKYADGVIHCGAEHL